jgi:hypothetical protein
MPNIWHKAIIRDQFPILIIKDNQIVGKARWSTSMDDITSMEIIEGQALEWTQDIAGKGEGTLPAKYYNPRYCDLTGSYQPRIEGGWEDLNDKFEYTRAVSEFYLHYGMVPDSFKDVPGYRCQVNRPSFLNSVE